MKLLYKVTFMDKDGNSNMDCVNVIASNAAHAIRRAMPLRSIKSWKPESVELIAHIDQ